MTAAVAVFFIVFGIAAAYFAAELIGGRDGSLLEGECFVFGGDVSYRAENAEKAAPSPRKEIIVTEKRPGMYPAA